MTASAQAKDPVSRLAVLLEAALATRSVDLSVDADEMVTAVPPIAGGHLFEEIQSSRRNPFVVPARDVIRMRVVKPPGFPGCPPYGLNPITNRTWGTRMRWIMALAATRDRGLTANP